MAIALDTLVYARRLREAGFSDAQAEGQAEALAAAMSDSLATKQDLHELESRIDARFARVDARFAQVDGRFAQMDGRFTQLDLRFVELEKRLELRFADVASRLDLANLEHRMTLRLGGISVAAVGVFSAIVKLL